MGQDHLWDLALLNVKKYTVDKIDVDTISSLLRRREK